jgi:rRNA-processing protein FCF1
MASDRLWGNKKYKLVILDSSAIMMLFEFSIDLENELKRILGLYKIIIPEPIKNELEFLSNNAKGKRKRIASSSLQLIKRYEIMKINEDFKGDDAVMHLGKKLNGYVVTNDKKLRYRLKKKSINIICLRGKNKLMLI